MTSVNLFLTDLFVCLFFPFFLFFKVIQFIYLFIYLFIYGCVGSSFLCEGFLQLQQVGATPSRCAGLSLLRPLLLQSTGSRRSGSVVVAHGPSCSVACGIFPDQGSNPCPLHWQADSQPLRHQGSPRYLFDILFSFLLGICPVVGLLGRMVVLFLVF